MADYALTRASNIILRTVDGVYIPVDSNNKDYQTYQAWLQGHVPDPYAALPVSPQDQFTARLALGMNTTWTLSGGPDGSLNGIYAVDQQTQFNITAEMVVILASGEFSTGTTQRYWLNQAGVPMLMSIAQFKALANAVGAYVNQLYAVLALLIAGQTASWPSNAVTIDA
jgi:hypothetical protein